MDPGTALAVVSLAIQLVGTVQSINDFLRTIHDAPSEVAALVETLDQTQSNLNQVRDLIQQQFSDARMASSPVFILNALKTCERRIKALEGLKSEMKASWSNQNLVKRTWASLNVRAKKLRIQELQSQLRDAISNLHFALSNNMLQLQLHQVQMATSHHTLVTDRLCALTATRSDALSIMPKGKVALPQSDQDHALAPAVTKPAFSMVTQRVNTIVAIESWLVKREVEICFGASFASIPRALRIYQIVDYDSHVFQLCERGDLEGLQAAFTDGSISPFLLDEYGFTLLDVAAMSFMPEMCSFLLTLGLDANRARDPHSPGYHGPANGADFMLSLDADRYEILSDAPEEGFYPALGAALREYSRGQDASGWESFIRRLLRTGVDVHAPVPRTFDIDPDEYPCALSSCGTPLDELFTFSKTASDGRTAADAWLQILSSEGYDIFAYLQREKALHATCPPITSDSFGYHLTPRQLVFDLGESPSVYADWWIDPKCAAYLVRQEFKDMAMIMIYDYFYFHWEDEWPFNYPDWALPWTYDHETLYKLAQRRADRRWQKKARKAARRNRTHGYHNMPGAWPGQ